MVSEYITNSEFQKLVKSLVALAFSTPTKIPIAFDILKPKLELACFPLSKYFEKMYIWGKVKKVTRQKTYYHDPCFPPSLWSVYENNQLGIPWTSNHAEAFHWKFSRRVLQKKVNILQLIKKLISEDHCNATKMINILENGNKLPVRKRNKKQVQQRIKFNRILSTQKEFMGDTQRYLANLPTFTFFQPSYWLSKPIRLENSSNSINFTPIVSVMEGHNKSCSGNEDNGDTFDEDDDENNDEDDDKENGEDSGDDLDSDQEIPNERN